MTDRFSRRDALKYMAAAGASTLLPFPSISRAKSKTPNVVFVLVDDQRWDAMGCAGKGWLKTPNMDRLASEGVRFENAFVTISLCSPSRACFLTGMYAHKNGVMHNGRVGGTLPATFLEGLKSAGYETAFMGKWHIGGLKMPHPRGVDDLVTFMGQGFYNGGKLFVNGSSVRNDKYITDKLTDYAVEFIRRPRSSPFCLYLSHKAVHAPMKPAPRHRGMYRDAPIEIPEEFISSDRELKNLLFLANQATNPEKMKLIMIDYYETLTAVDESLGRVLEALDTTGQAENTIVIYTSDNGYLWGEHALIDKRVAYEESIRIPMLARFPAGISDPGRVIPEMVHHLDVCPTFLQLAGAPVPDAVQGSSLIPLLRGENTDWRRLFLYEYFYDFAWPTPPCLAVRTEEWKYITYPTSGKADELYNLKDDPKEQNNLAMSAEGARQLVSMRIELERLKIDTGYPGRHE